MKALNLLLGKKNFYYFLLFWEDIIYALMIYFKKMYLVTLLIKNQNQGNFLDMLLMAK